MQLTEGQHSALQNLARKKAGKDVEWITIADARALTELGLAERDSSGWRITAEGEAKVGKGSDVDPRGAQIISSPVFSKRP